MSNFSIEVIDESSVRRICFKGGFDEDLDIESILPEIKPNMVFDMEGIHKITSFGVKLWIDFLKKIPDSYEISYVNCSISFVDQANMISNFVQKGQIKSYHAPFICKNENEFDVTLKTGEVGYSEEEYLVKDIKCKQCGAESELDEFPEDYFGFLGLEDE